MDIIIDKSKVLKEVRKTLEYMGFRTITDDGGNVYDILSASSEQEEMLDRFFEEGCSNIAYVDKEYVTLTKLETETSTYSAGSYICTFSDAVNSNYEIFIKQDIFSYLVNYIIWQWLLLGNIALDRIQTYQLLAIGFLRSYAGWLGSNTRGTSIPPEGGNDLGESLPQEFGTRNIVRTILCKY